MIFWGPILGGFPGELPQKILGEKIAFAAQQLYTKIKFQFRGLGEEERTKFRKKKKKKKGNKPHCGQKWVSLDERVC